jgi:ribosome modulation factor
LLYALIWWFRSAEKGGYMPNHEDDDLDLDDEIDEEEEAPQPRKQAKARKQPKRESRQSREAKANAEAQQRGQEAYANGEPRTANPYEQYSSTKSYWAYGWGEAWFAATGAKGIPVYSNMPTSFCTLAEANAIERRISTQLGNKFLEARDIAPALPWTLDQLAGTRWINIFTGQEEAIGPICIDRWGQAVAPRADDPFACTADDPFRRYINALGLWWNDRYVVEHWIRSDIWEPAQRLVWFSTELAHIRSSSISIGDPERQKKREREALAKQQQFADQHGLVLTTEQINAGRGQRRDGKPEQLSLF